MQELTYEEMNQMRETAKVQKTYEIPRDARPVSVDVKDGDSEVLMTVDGKVISMPIEGARNLALALRQSANRIERQYRKG